MGQYEVKDFVLLLISYAISGERTLLSAPAKCARGFLQSNNPSQGSVDEPRGAAVLSISILFKGSLLIVLA